jgi:hypothetical protein
MAALETEMTVNVNLVPAPRPLFPHDSASRKAIPVMSGVLDYFPSALAEVAKVSKAGNDKHNPGQPLHHARGKSMDHGDALIRHIMEFRADPDAVDPDTGLSVLAHAMWRVGAMLQEHLESRGAPVAPGARFP